MAHAIVIGGGPGGCSAALALRAGGWRVTLIENRAFPRMKVCGEFISPAATSVLERWLGPGELRAAGAQRVDRLVLELGDREASWAMPRAAWVLSRRALDALLLERVKHAGATVLQPESATRASYAECHARVEFASARVIEGDVIVHADGHGRLDAGSDGAAPGPTRARAGVIGHKCHIRVDDGRLAGVLRMRAAAGAYVGTVGVEGGEATVALVARTSMLKRFGGDLDALLTSAWPAYRQAWRTSPWLSTGVARGGYRRPGHARSFRIGNAAAAVEPVGGEGIGLALWSGASVGDLLAPLAGACDGAVDAAALVRIERGLARAYRERLRWRRPACRAASMVLERPRLVGALWPVLERRIGRAALLAPWYALSGKGLAPRVGAV